MTEEFSHLLEFGRFRLDTCNKMLWHDGSPVSMPLKEIELLSALVENRGELVTKSDLLNKVWEDAFVEESNLSRHIYLLRKVFKDFGENEELIQNVPRRGYRFAGAVREIADGEVIEKNHNLTQTAVEAQDVSPKRSPSISPTRLAHGSSLSSRLVLSMAAVAILLSAGIFLFSAFRNNETVVKAGKTSSIAVMPLKSFSGDDREGEEMNMRITDALITRLGSLDGITVRPTSAVLSFANNEYDVIEAGKRLRVDSVLEGRIQQEGNRLRVTMQLVSVATGEHMWSAQFDGRADQTLELQEIITAKVSRSLDPDMRGQPRLARRPTDNPEAYEAYLKGRYFWYKRDESSLRRAIEYFTKASEIDPGFSEAYSGIADSQHLLFNYNIEVNPELIVKAKDNLKRALELNPNSADALITLGSIRMGYDWDWKGAEDALKRAVDIEPNSAMAHIRYGVLLIRIRRFDEAQAEFERSLELDPLSLIGKMNLGMTYFCRKDFASAESVFRYVLEIDDKVAGSHWLLSRTLWQMGRKDEAINEILLGLESDGNIHLAEKLRAKSASASHEDVIRLLLYEWRTVPPETNKSNLAYLSTYFGDSAAAIHWIEQSFEERHPWTAWIAAYPEFESLYNEPRYQKLLQQANLMY